jgi:hypothetical protein
MQADKDVFRQDLGDLADAYTEGRSGLAFYRQMRRICQSQHSQSAMQGYESPRT